MSDTPVTPMEAGRAVVEAVRLRLDALTADLSRLRKAEELGKSMAALPLKTPSMKQIADGDPDQSKAKPVMTKTVFQILGKGETFIDMKHSADPKKRFVDVGFEGKVPSDEKEKEVSADEGGDIKKAVVDITKPPKPVKAAVADMKTAVADMKTKVSGTPVKKAGADMSAKPPAAQMPSAPKTPAPKGAAGGTVPKAPKAPGAEMTVKKEVGVFARLAKRVK